MSTLEKIENLSKLANEKRNLATSDEDWIEINSLWNELGRLLEAYGRDRYKRHKKINLILEKPIKSK